jgi:hypothetical protein
MCAARLEGKQHDLINWGVGKQFDQDAYDAASDDTIFASVCPEPATGDWHVPKPLMSLLPGDKSPKPHVMFSMSNGPMSF